ncbi:MAG: type II secretion system F family protein [Akkermansiaceae bacterium]|nr:type II secretion system F family protein [Akkermansiaceae bacterium]
MAIFTYKALSSGGSVTTGELDAADRNEALRRLERKGLQPVQLKQSSDSRAQGKSRASASGKTASNYEEGPVRLKRAEVVLFTEELSDMLGAGLQLEPALKAMENRQELGNLKEVSWKIRQIVRDGSNFSVALRRVSPSFGPLYCSLAAAGEASQDVAEEEGQAHRGDDDEGQRGEAAPLPHVSGSLLTRGGPIG